MIKFFNTGPAGKDFSSFSVERITDDEMSKDGTPMVVEVRTGYGCILSASQVRILIEELQALVGVKSTGAFVEGRL